MQYFQTLPQINLTDYSGTTKTMVNLLARASIIPSLMEDPLLYYTYDITDGETVEMIADRYYGDPYRYWIILFSNQMLDPQWDWPLDRSSFEKYVVDKYSPSDPYSSIYGYQKVVTQYESSTETTTINKYAIDETTYNSLVNSTQTYVFNSGSTTITTEKRILTYYDYELELNESKRTIKIIKSDYAEKIENELSNLMATK